LRNNRSLFFAICRCSSAKYAARIDADDAMDKDFLKIMIEYADENKLDIAACGYNKINGETGEVLGVKQSDKNFVVTGDGFRDDFIKYRGFTIYLWAKLYNLDFYNQKIILNNKDNSDIEQAWDSTAMLKIINESERFGVVGRPMMDYYIYPDSLSNKLSLNICDSYFNLYSFTREYIEARGEVSAQNESFLQCIYLSIIDELIMRVLTHLYIECTEKYEILSRILSNDWTICAFSYKCNNTNFNALIKRDEWLCDLTIKIKEFSLQHAELLVLIEDLRRSIPE